MIHGKGDAEITAIIDREMRMAGVPADQWETVRRALILSLHPTPLQTAEGPGMAADLLLGLAAMDAAPDASPEVVATAEGTRDFLIANGALTTEENTR